MGEEKTHKHNLPQKIQRQSRENCVYVFFLFICFFAPKERGFRRFLHSFAQVCAFLPSFCRVAPLQNEIAPKNFNSRTKSETKSEMKNTQKHLRNNLSPAQLPKIFHQHFLTVLHPEFQTQFQTPFQTFCFHAQYDWTTGVPYNGNEWRKFCAVPRLYPIAFPCFILCLIGVETEGPLDYQGQAGIISIVRWNRVVKFLVDC